MGLQDLGRKLDALLHGIKYADGRTHWISSRIGPNGNPFAPEKLTQVPMEEADLVSSLCHDGFQRPVIDLDFPCSLTSSASPDHYHLYLDRPLTYAEYERLLGVMVDVGLVEQGVLHFYLEHRMTMARLPGKPKDLKDARTQVRTY